MQNNAKSNRVNPSRNSPDSFWVKPGSNIGFNPNSFDKIEPDLAPAREKPIVKIISWFLGLLSIIISVIVYYTTTCPVVYYGDAGELITAAYRFGVAHPPGYPAYIIPLGIWLRLPLGWLAPHTEYFQQVAWQANFFSAVVGAFAIWIVYLIILRLGKNPWIAFAGALLAMTGRTFWSQTGIAEVYTLNALLAGIMVLIALIQIEKPAGSKGRLRFFKYGSLVWGLSLSNHHEMAFFFPLWLMMLWAAIQPGSDKSQLRIPPLRIFNTGAIFIGLGLLPYLYLPIASATNPPLDWGDPDNLRNFFRVLTRAEYRQAKDIITGDTVTSLDILVRFLWWSAIQYFPLFLLLAIPGFGFIFRKSVHRPALIATFISIFLMSFIFIIYFGGIDRSSFFFLEVYFIPWYLSLAVLISLGSIYLLPIITKRIPKISGIYLALAVVILFIAVFIGYKANHQSADMSDNIAGYIYSHDVIATLPASPGKSILVTGGDEIFLFWYWKWVEGVDRDIACVGMDALGVMKNWFWKDLQRDQPGLNIPNNEGLELRYEGNDLSVQMLESLIRGNRGNYRVFMTAWDTVFDPVLHEGPWHMVLDGPVLEIEYDSEGNITDYPRASASEDTYLFKALLDVSREGLAPFEEEIYDRYAAACYNLAIYFGRNSQPERAADFATLCLQFRPDYSAGPRAPTPAELLAFNLLDAGNIDLAREKLQELIAQNPENSLYHSYMAEIYLADGNVENALQELETAMRIDPANVLIRERYQKIRDAITEQTAN